MLEQAKPVIYHEEHGLIMNQHLSQDLDMWS